MKDDVCAVGAVGGNSGRAAVLVAPLLAVGSMLSIQLGAALAHPVMETYGAFSTTWLRLCIAAVVLGVIVRPPLLAYSRRQWGSALALGVAMAAMTLCFFRAIQQVPLGLAVAIEFLGPLTVAAVGVRRPLGLVWPAIAAVGVALLARHDGMWVASLGQLALPAGAALGWGAYIVLMKRVGSQFEGVQGLAVSLMVAALVATPFGIAESGARMTGAQLGATVGLAVLVPLMPYVLELLALRRMKAAAFGILMSAEPAIGALIGFGLLGQALGWGQCVGMGLVVGASVAVVVRERAG